MKPILACTLILAATPLAAARAEDVAHGKQLFMSAGCYQCHGTVGQGGGVGPRISPPPWPTAAMISYVRQPAGQMPPYSPKVLSDADVGDIHAYLATIAKPKVSDSKLPTPRP